MGITTQKARLERLLYAEHIEAYAPRYGSRFDYAGDCERPVHMHVIGKPDAVSLRLGIEDEGDLAGWMVVQCRKCAACLMKRTRIWTARAIDEIEAADRTWFGTLTVRPEDRVRISYARQLWLASRGVTYATLSSEEQYSELVAELSKEVTLFLKRLRKASGARLRYLLVAEAHKDGFPHFHLLIHEWEGSATKRQLDGCWRIGFSQFRLVGHEKKAAVYACKYLAKSALARIRASQGYGRVCKARVARRVIDSVLTVAKAAGREITACSIDRSPLALEYRNMYEGQKGMEPQEK